MWAARYWAKSYWPGSYWNALAAGGYAPEVSTSLILSSSAAALDAVTAGVVLDSVAVGIVLDVASIGGGIA